VEAKPQPWGIFCAKEKKWPRGGEKRGRRIGLGRGPRRRPREKACSCGTTKRNAEKGVADQRRKEKSQTVAILEKLAREMNRASGTGKGRNIPQ